MEKYSIGIDTGGTYTDAVLLDNATHQVINWAKKPTSHHDLGIGVGQVLEQLLTGGVQPEEISRITLLVRRAIGFNATRGDSIEVINSSFMAPASPTLNSIA